MAVMQDTPNSRFYVERMEWMLGALARPTPFVEQTVLLGTVIGKE